MKRLSALIFFMLVNSIAIAAEEIIWLIDDKEDLPFLKTNNARSIGMDTVNLVLNQLEDFDLTLQVASVSRIDQQLKKTENTCVSSRIKTPSRAKINAFSLPVNMHPSPKLYFYPDTIHLPESIIKNGSLTSLSRLMEFNPGKTIALNENVSYGEEIDRQLQSLDKKHLTFLNVDNRSEATFKLFVERLVDFTIDYPSGMKDQLSAYGNREKVQSIGFSSNTRYVLSHIACSKSELGAAFIASTNKILNKLYSTEQFLNAHIRHIDQSSIPDFTKDFTDVFQGSKIADTLITVKQ